METKAKCEALSNTHYGNNYDEIFKDYSLKLDKQMPTLNEFDIYSSNESSSETNYGDRNDKFFQDNGLVNGIGHYGQGNENFLTYQSNNNSNIAAFDILQSSFPLLSNDQNYSFLTNDVN